MLNKAYPGDYWKYISIPLLSSFEGPGSFQNGIVSPLIVGFYFQYYCYYRYRAWWKQYNATLSIAIDAGVGICVLSTLLVRGAGWESKLWAMNPDIGRGVPVDYYCLEKGWKM